MFFRGVYPPRYFGGLARPWAWLARRDCPDGNLSCFLGFTALPDAWGWHTLTYASIGRTLENNNLKLLLRAAHSPPHTVVRVGDSAPAELILSARPSPFVQAQGPNIKECIPSKFLGDPATAELKTNAHGLLLVPYWHDMLLSYAFPVHAILSP